jgi:hypothetical protein
MTVTEINIKEVKAFVDAALEGLQKELRELNHQVKPGCFCSNSVIEERLTRGRR